MLQTHKILLERNGKYLVMLRPDNCRRYADHWDLPGGKSEVGEEFHQTILREVEEEIGAEVIIGKQIFHFEIESECIRGEMMNFYLHNAQLQDPEAKITLSPEHVEYRWLTLDEIDRKSVV